jgi:hypothetical protein
MATNLEFIKSASGTSVSSLSVTDCFSDKYDVYQIFISKLNGLQASGGRVVQMRFIDNLGSVISASEYDYATMNMRSYDVFEQFRATNATDFLYTIRYETADTEGGVSMNIYNPNDSSSYTFANWQSAGTGTSDRLLGYKSIGVHKSAEQITGVYFFPNADTFDLTVKVFGVK